MVVIILNKPKTGSSSACDFFGIKFKVRADIISYHTSFDVNIHDNIQHFKF